MIKITKEDVEKVLLEDFPKWYSRELQKRTSSCPGKYKSNLETVEEWKERTIIKLHEQIISPDTIDKLVDLHDGILYAGRNTLMNYLRNKFFKSKIKLNPVDENDFDAQRRRIEDLYRNRCTSEKLKVDIGEIFYLLGKEGIVVPGNLYFLSFGERGGMGDDYIDHSIGPLPFERATIERNSKKVEWFVSAIAEEIGRLFSSCGWYKQKEKTMGIANVWPDDHNYSHVTLAGFATNHFNAIDGFAKEHQYLGKLAKKGYGIRIS